MRRTALSLMAAATACLWGVAAPPVSYLDCNFESGMPEGFTLHDADGGKLHFTMVQLGFGETDSWTVLRESGTENHYAASASRFKTAKGEAAPSAEDWMVTPPVWIRASDASLSWKGMSVNERNDAKSTYWVMVSDTGDTPSDFVAPPLMVVENEASDGWATHSVDLGEYVGKRVRIAFVNVSSGSDVLAIDDISVVGGSGVASLEILPGAYTLGKEEITFGGVLTATSDKEVNTLSVSFEVDGKTMEAAYSGLALSEGESFEFTLPEKISAGYGDTVSFTAKAEVNGVEYDTMNLSTTLLAFMPKKRVVVEEATGMWCGYCPEGIVAMETLQERYPEEFIGIAVHVDDKMSVKGYADSMSFPSGAPTAWVDRKLYSESPLQSITVNGEHTWTTLRGGLESMLLERLADQPLAEVEVAVSEMDDSGKIDVAVTGRFAKGFSGSDMRVALVMTEDHVWEDGYYQTNYHSGRDETIGGFESLPSVIDSDFEFNHVARGVYGDWRGIEGSLPSEIEPATPYSYNVAWSVPEKVDASHTKVVAMIVDAATGEVMNAAGTYIGSSGVSAIEGSATVTIAGGNGSVSATGDGEIELSVYTLTGRHMAVAKGSGAVAVGNLPAGVYVAVANNGKSTKTAKVAVR